MRERSNSEFLVILTTKQMRKDPRKQHMEDVFPCLVTITWTLPARPSCYNSMEECYIAMEGGCPFLKKQTAETGGRAGWMPWRYTFIWKCPDLRAGTSWRAYGLGQRKGAQVLSLGEYTGTHGGNVWRVSRHRLQKQCREKTEQCWGFQLSRHLPEVPFG